MLIMRPHHFVPGQSVTVQLANGYRVPRKITCCIGSARISTNSAVTDILTKSERHEIFLPRREEVNQELSSIQT